MRLGNRALVFPLQLRIDADRLLIPPIHNKSVNVSARFRESELYPHVLTDLGWLRRVTLPLEAGWRPH